MQCPQCGKEAQGELCAACGAAVTEETPRWYAEGIAHLTQEQQFSIARDLLKEGLQRYPTSAMLWFNGGLLEEMMGNRRGAYQHYQQALTLRPQSEKYRQALERLTGKKIAPPVQAIAPPPAVPVVQPVTPAIAPSALAATPAVPVVAMPAEVEEAELSLLEPAPAEVLTAEIEVEEETAEDGVMELPGTTLPPENEADALFIPAPAASASFAAPAVVEADNVPAPAPPPTQQFDLLAWLLGFGYWGLISRICGIIGIASFVLLLVFLIRGSGGLFTIDLLCFAVTVILYFAGKALAGGK